MNRFGELQVVTQLTDNGGDGAEPVTVRVNDFTVPLTDGRTFSGSAIVERSLEFTQQEGAAEETASLATLRGLKADVARLLEEQHGLRGDDLEVLPRLGSITITSEQFGSVTLPTSLVFRPYAKIEAPDRVSVNDPVEVETSLFATLTSSDSIDTSQPITLRIRLGDGAVVEQQLESNFSAFSLTHDYLEAGTYTISVTGTATPANGVGTIAIPETCHTITVFDPQPVVPDTPGDDDISLRNENGRVIAKVNGVDEDLGASEEIVQVEIQLTRGNNTVDASGLLETQSLFVPSIVNLDSETNTITGGPGDDTIFGGRGPDLIFAGLGNDVITTNRGDDEAHGQGGDDTFVIPGGFNFGAAFENQLKEMFGGEGFDTLKIADLQDELLMLAPQFSDEEFEAQLNLFKGVGSSRPGVHAFIADLEKLFIAPQSEEVNVSLPNAGYFEDAEVNGSPEDDRFNFTNSQIEAIARLFDGDDEYLGGLGTDVVDGGGGDDDLKGAGGDDVLSGGTGANELDGGAGDDRYSLFFSESGEEPTFDEITDTSGDRDALGLIGFVQGLSLDLNTGATQEIAPGVSVDLNLQTGRPIEDVAFQPLGDQPFTFRGTNADNVFSVVPIDIQFGGLGQPPVVTIGDGLGGNDLVTDDPDGLTRFNPFDLAPEASFPGSEGMFLVANSAPNSGDAIDVGANAVVTAGFPDAFRAVNVDLDLQGIDQVVDANGNTTRFESPVRHFVGSAFDDTLQIDANLSLRRVAGGDGTDSVTIDAGGRPVTQTVDGAETTVQVAGYAPIVVTEFETITIANAAPAGGLAFDLSPGADNALLTLQSIVDDGATMLGRFALSESLGAFPEQSFLHQGGATEIRSAGGADNLTIDALGRPVEVVGADILIGGLPAIRLVGFSEVTIEDAGLPGDYNRDRRVNAADYTVWRDNVGAAAGALPNDIDGGEIGQAQYDTWLANYGRSADTEVFVLPAPTTEVPAQAAELEAIDLALAHLGATTDQAARSPNARVDNPPTAAATDDLLLLLESENARTAQRDREQLDDADDEPDTRTADGARASGHVSSDVRRIATMPRSAFRRVR